MGRIRMVSSVGIGLGLAALVACTTPSLNSAASQTGGEYPLRNPEDRMADGKTKPIPQFLDLSSFGEAEDRLRQYARNGRDEQAWATDGIGWKDVGGIATPHSNQVDEEAIQEALSSGLGGVIYFYHQHGVFDIDGYPVSNVPSVSDLISNIIFNRKANRYDKRVVSRVVEVYGTWEFVVDDSPTIYPQNEDSIWEALFPTGEAVRDLPQRLREIQTENRHRKVHDQIQHLLVAYDQVGGVSMRFMPHQE